MIDVFGAMADPTRRAVIERLSGGPASTSDLARSIEITLPSMARHGDPDTHNRHAEMGIHEGWSAALDQLVALAKTL